jgi:hypothetical protein
VGRPDTDSYVVLPADGAALLRRLCDGVDRTEAADWYAREFGESVDIDGFLDTLREMDLVSNAPDADQAGSDAPADADRADRRSPGPRRHGCRPAASQGSGSQDSPEPGARRVGPSSARGRPAWGARSALPVHDRADTNCHGIHGALVGKL